MTDINDTIKNKLLMLEALEANKNIVTVSAQCAGIHRDSHYRWMKEDPEYAEKVNALNDTAIDWVENKLYDLINLGDTTATIFYLKTKGRKRGFNERLELSHETPEGLDIKVEFIKPENT